MNLSAEGTEDLDDQLSKTDISVPPRGGGRTTDDCERWSITHFLATLNHYDQLQFPLHLTKRERPDFSIEIGDESWGVEVTEAISTSIARALAIAAKENPKAILDMSLFRYGEEKSLEEIREIVNASKLEGDGWVGQGPERELAHAIRQIVSNKTQKLRQKGFSKFSSNILLVYENMHLPQLDLEAASAFIASELSAYWGESETFDHVYIESHSKMLAFHARGRRTVTIPKLWQ